MTGMAGVSNQMSVIRDRERGAAAKAGVSSVEDLEVFQRAYRASLEPHRASLQFPKIEQFAGLADQIRRASKSICGNLAEGFGKQLGSADEMQVWLRYCSDLEYVDRSACGRWRDEYRQIARMLQGLYTNWRGRSDP